jgi:hypothetical protein
MDSTRPDLEENDVRGAIGQTSTRSSQAVITAVVVSLALVAGTVAASAQTAAKDFHRNAQRTTFSDAEIAEGFFKIAFGAELGIIGNDDRIRKFDEPVRVFLDDRANANRRADLAAIIADISRHVANLDIAMTSDRSAANIVVTLVRDHSQFLRTLRTFYGPVRARDIERRLAPQCLSGFGQYPDHRIRRSEVILAADGGDAAFFNCAYEELLQALGPINDDRSIPWSMFNDDVQMGFFDVYDQYLLNILYDPRIRPGMTRQKVTTLLPAILPTVRESISLSNSELHLDAGAVGELTAVVPGRPPMLTPALTGPSTGAP